MVQIFFLDTNVVLDYLENRNHEVRDIVAQLLHYHKQNKIHLVTSVFNIAEIAESEFQICFWGACINERMSYDEIMSKKNDRKLFKQIAEKNKDDIKKKIKKFVVYNELEAFSLSLNDQEHYEEIYKLIYDFQLRLQDALVVAAALENNATYFLSNDSDLVNTIGELINCYDLRDKGQRKSFEDDVLQAI